MNTGATLPLKDIHLPPPITAWPPAPGWWVAGALVIAGVVAIGIAVVRHRRRTAYRRAALATARNLAHDFAQHRDATRLANECSELLRRVAIAAYGITAAGISGDDWLHFLDQGIVNHGPLANRLHRPPSFAQLKAALLVAPYRPAVSYDAQALQQALQYWIRYHKGH